MPVGLLRRQIVGLLKQSDGRCKLILIGVDLREQTQAFQFDIVRQLRKMALRREANRCISEFERRQRTALSRCIDAVSMFVVCCMYNLPKKR